MIIKKSVFLRYFLLGLCAFALLDFGNVTRAYSDDLPEELKSIFPEHPDEPPELEGLWTVLGEVEIEENDGFLIPTYTQRIKKIDGQPVTIEGFMLPMEQSEKQQVFLLSAFPPSCPFCVGGDSTTILEVRAKESVSVTYDKLKVDGIMNLIEDDPMGLFYRISEAEVRPAE